MLSKNENGNIIKSNGLVTSSGERKDDSEVSSNDKLVDK
jgi:hypothetical protein